jgi:hypothetical protein
MVIAGIRATPSAGLVRNHACGFSRVPEMLAAQYAPLIFSTATLLCVLLFFSVADH